MNADTAHRPTDHTVTKESFVRDLAARMRPPRWAVLGAALLGFFIPSASAASAQAVSPWWNLNTSLRPASIQPGGEGTLVLQAANLGDAPTTGPVTLSATLPAGVTVAEEEAVPQVRFFGPLKTPPGVDFGPTGPFASHEMCHVSASQVSCSTALSPELEFLEPFLAQIAPYEQLEVRVKLIAAPGAQSGEYDAKVSGGEAATASRRRPLPIGEAAPAFGAEDLSLIPEAEGGQVDPRAGAHPFQLTNTFNLNQTADPARPPAAARSLAFQLPPGQLGNATAIPKCSAADFNVVAIGYANLCPADTALGVAIVTIYEPIITGLSSQPVPVFNLEPKHGEPARFGFIVLGTPVILDTSLRSGPGADYGVTVAATNTSELANLIASTVTFWGTPGDSRHDSSRGWGCLAGGHWSNEGEIPCEASNQAKPPAFLTLPTNCAAPFATSVEGISWPNQAFPSGAPLVPLSYSLQNPSGSPLGLIGCNQLPFAPQIHAEPTSNAATSPTGLNFDIDVNDEGLISSGGLAQSQIKKAVVTLPQGFTTNPSVAEGLKACSREQYESETVDSAPGSGCPNASKVGDVEIESPLVEPVVHGSLYVARQHDNPYGNLLTLYLVAKNPEIGIIVKQALKVTPDPKTGQLVTEVDNIPQLPFSRFRLSFRQGQRSPLITPPTCGNYTVKALLYPWARPSEPIEESKSFQITQGPEGGPCPNGTPPFHPNLLAGSENPTAGAYSPFYTDITRKDSEQEITHFSIKLPPGVVGKLAGIPFCSEAGILAAKEREHEGGGGEEEANPSCPASSQIGHSNVGSGVGNVLAYAPGKLYLAGPYHGSNLSIVSITAAKVGPFDLGTVVVRFALRVNPETAEVSVDGAKSDPIPHIVDGIPIHLRDIQAFVDRPEFTLNPTSCDKTSTASTVLGSGLDFASEADDVPVTVTSPFQVGSCASLPFGPRLSLKLLGATKRTGHPRLKATLRMNGIGEASISRAQVTLPKSEFLDQGHLNNICTRVQFKEGGGNGEKCPAASVYGYARAVTPILSEPLEGPVFLRSSEHKLPDLVAALHSGEINIDLDGRIDSLHGQIRNTFEAVPDAPVTSFTLEMQGGRKGLLINSTNLCQGKHRAIADFTGHNGKLHDFNPVVGARCGKGKKGKHRHVSH